MFTYSPGLWPGAERVRSQLEHLQSIPWELKMTKTVPQPPSWTITHPQIHQNLVPNAPKIGPRSQASNPSAQAKQNQQNVQLADSVGPLPYPQLGLSNTPKCTRIGSLHEVSPGGRSQGDPPLRGVLFVCGGAGRREEEGGERRVQYSTVLE